jgi:subtilisin-like proprotein convertase family protein
MNHFALPRRRGIALAVMGALLAFVLALTAEPAGAAVFSSTSPIVIPATGTSGQSNPYPSTIAVSGLPGAITNVDVTLTGASHTYPADIDVLLVGPFGQNVVLLADTGGSTDINNANLTFDDAALTLVPAVIVSGTYRPTNGGAFSGTAPAPAGPYGTALSVFNGTVPNGTWKLFVFDDLGGDTGSIAGGWRVDITTNGPAISSFTPTTGPAGTQVVISGSNFTGASSVTFGGIAATVFTVNSATQITATVPNGALSGPITVTTANGHASSATNYQVSPPPTITSFTPTRGKVGRNIAILGTELTGATEVRFGGTPAATFTVNSATQITAKIPAGAGTGLLTVTNAGGTGTSTARFVVQHDRSLSLVVTQNRAKGRLTADDGFAKAAAGVPVRLQRRTLAVWRTVGRDLTTAKGRYTFTGQFGSGRYRVLAPRTTLSSGDIALRAASPIVRR